MANVKRVLPAGMIVFVLACALPVVGRTGGGVTPAPNLPTEHPVGPSSVPVVESPTPSLPVMVKIGEDGCCAGPEWSADGARVIVIDKPTENDPAGMYGIPAEGGPAALISQQIGLFSADGKILAFVNEKNQTILREISSGADTVFENHGQRPWISPDDRRVAWVMGANIDATIGTRVDLFMADFDGANYKALLTVYNGGIVGWLDADHLLVLGRKSASPGNIDLFSLDVNDGTQVDIASETRIRDVTLSPGGEWVSYAVTFDTAEPPDNGIWVARIDGGSRYRLDVIGPVQWRDDHRALVIPMEMGAASHRLWQFDMATGVGGDLTDPAVTPFRIEGGYWRVSPDGARMVFMSAADRALWMMTLPE